MIRFIDIGKQVGLDDDWPREFSFWNTVTDRFITAHGEQMWSSWDEFEQAWKLDESMGYDLKRFHSLCPDWIFNAREQPPLSDPVQAQKE